MGRTRRLAAIALVCGLAAAWIATSHRGQGGAHDAKASALAAVTTGVPQSPAHRASVPTGGSSGGGNAIRALLAGGTRCLAAPTDARSTRCSVSGVDVDYRLVGEGSLRTAYLTAVVPGLRGGSATLGLGSGPPACARGAEDERAWSRPAAPRRAVGRYACRIERGRAAMWWTVDDRGLLAHAVAADGGLTSLFAWWESHSER